MTAEEE